MIKLKLMKTPSVTGAVVVVLDDQDRTLLLLRPKEARWAPFKWGFPGGKIEEGESALSAAIRETKEETQLNVKNLRALNLKVAKAVATYYTRDYTGAVKIDFEPRRLGLGFSRRYGTVRSRPRGPRNVRMGIKK